MHIHFKAVLHMFDCFNSGVSDDVVQQRNDTRPRGSDATDDEGRSSGEPLTKPISSTSYDQHRH